MKMYHVYNSKPADDELNILFAGSQQCSPCYSFKGRRDHYIIHYVVEGSGQLYINNKKHQLKRGCSFIISPMQRNKYQASSRSPWKYRWIGFSGERVRGMLKSVGISEKECIFRQPFSEEMEACYQEMFELLESKESGYHIRITSLFLQIIWMLQREKKTLPSLNGKSVNYVRTSVDFIERNYYQKISVENIAQFLGINRSYFSHLFHKEIGVSVQEYLIGFRMEKAKEYLISSAYLVEEIAQSVGYQNYNTFSKSFRKLTGYSPTEYRNKFTVRLDNYYYDEEE